MRLLNNKTFVITIKFVSLVYNSGAIKLHLSFEKYIVFIAYTQGFNISSPIIASRYTLNPPATGHLTSCLVIDDDDDHKVAQIYYHHIHYAKHTVSLIYVVYMFQHNFVCDIGQKMFLLWHVKHTSYIVEFYCVVYGE